MRGLRACGLAVKVYRVDIVLTQLYFLGRTTLDLKPVNKPDYRPQTPHPKLSAPVQVPHNIRVAIEDKVCAES